MRTGWSRRGCCARRQPPGLLGNCGAKVGQSLVSLGGHLDAGPLLHFGHIGLGPGDEIGLEPGRLLTSLSHDGFGLGSGVTERRGQRLEFGLGLGLGLLGSSEFGLDLGEVAFMAALMAARPS